MRRSGTTTRYGQKGGDGPNTGKKSVTFYATAPDGTPLKKRFFNCPAAGLETAVAALIPPVNGYGWYLWTVAVSQETMPDYVLRTVAKDNSAIVFVPCSQTKPDKDARYVALSTVGIDFSVSER